MEKWVLAAKRADFQEIGRKYGIDPVIARIIRNRDITEDAEINQYLNGTLDDIPSWKSLKDIDKAVEIISQKIDLGIRMRIIGDYDIDGVTATYILLKGFKRLGANVDTYIPDRIADGYGIHNHLIEKAKEDGVDTIVTCDNGISAADQIAFAKKMGMTVVVTDHHEVPFEDTEEGRKYKLPLADAIINPKQSDCTYPNKNICGAVVAMKLVFALYEKYGIPEREKEDYLEPAAIATVGDIMDLQGENRILVKEGLLRLPHTKNKGLKALIRAIGLENQKISSYDIGFRLGPCINASGRLDTAMRSMSLLQCEDEEEAARKREQISNELKKPVDPITIEIKNDSYHLINGFYFAWCVDGNLVLECKAQGDLILTLRDDWNKETIRKLGFDSPSYSVSQLDRSDKRKYSVWFEDERARFVTIPIESIVSCTETGELTTINTITEVKFKTSKKAD